MNELTGLANSAAKQHKKEKREQGGYEAKGRAAGASTAAAQRERGARANEQRGKKFQAKRRPAGQVRNTAHKRDTTSKLSGINKGVPVKPSNQPLVPSLDDLEDLDGF